MPPFGFDDVFEVEQAPKEPVNPWLIPVVTPPTPRPDYADDENLKKLFGIELGKGVKAFEAATLISDGNSAKALWISCNWLSDPVVIGSRDAYLLTLKEVAKPLTKEELLAKLLEINDQKLDNGMPLYDAKDRIQALSLYAEIQGLKGKNSEQSSDNIVNNTFNKITKVVLVSPTIVKSETNTNIKSKMQNIDIPSLPLKLVGGVSR
jgi:hypothetical protein